MNPVYRVILQRAAARELDQLPPKTWARVLARIEALSENPRPAGARKLTGTTNRLRIRVGRYRVVYEIDDLARQVHVYVVGHRKEVYR